MVLAFHLYGTVWMEIQMRLPNTAQTSRPWRIHELTRDFRLEDVWALPTPGGPDDFRRLVHDFPRLVQGISSHDASQGSAAARTLWAIRWKLGELLGWDDPDAGLGSRVPTLRDRLPADLRDAPPGPDLNRFTSLYLLDDEWAAEIANKTVHGVIHLSWVPDGTGGYRGQMAVYVKPNGLFGAGYMAAIAPFRHLIVYPAMMRQVEQKWRALTGDPTPPVRAERCEVVERTRDLLAEADYADAFRVAADASHQAEQWARSAFEGGPPGTRGLFGLVVWRGMLGLRLGPLDSPDHVAGWEIVENEPERVVLHADSWMLVARLVFDVSDVDATMTTVMRYDRRVAHGVWAVLGIAHRSLAPQVLDRAARSLARQARASERAS